MGIKTPLQALALFLHVFAHFEWRHHIVTWEGPVVKATMKLMHSTRKPFMQAKVVKQFHERAQVAAKLSPADCPTDACGVLDPLDHHNNLARSVSPDALFRMQKACERGSVALADTLSDASLGYAFAEHFFKRSYEQLRLGS